MNISEEGKVIKVEFTVDEAKGLAQNLITFARKAFVFHLNSPSIQRIHFVGNQLESSVEGNDVFFSKENCLQILIGLSTRIIGYPLNDDEIFVEIGEFTFEFVVKENG